MGTNFNHLNVPQYWEQYWSKYPQVYTILEALLNWVKSVDDMTDFMNDWDDRLEEFILNYDGETVKNNVRDLITEWKNNGDLEGIISQVVLDGKVNVADLAYTKLGNAMVTKDSVYTPNDANYFGYRNDGAHSNLATVQQNNILQYGDPTSDIMWLVTGKYHSFRAPINPSYQKIDAAGNPIEGGRTLLHTGISNYHNVLFASGNQTLPQNTYTDLALLDTISSVFPAGGYSGGYYTVPRAGMYDFSLTLKFASAPASAGYMRVRLHIIRAAGGTTDSDKGDILYDSTKYGTGFHSLTMKYELGVGDKVRVEVNPLNSSVTVGPGSSLYMYFLGDMPTA